MIDNRIVGKTIATLRQEREMTQQQLAAALNVSHQAVSKWENGAALPDVQTMLDLTALFGITIEQLLSGNIPTHSEEEEAPSDPLQSIGTFVSGVIDDIGNMFKPASPAEGATQAQNAEPGEGEAGNVDLNNLLQTAPFMSKAAVAEMLDAYGKKLTPTEIARFAPFVESAYLEKLIRYNAEEVNWDTLRRVAPFLKKEAVDSIARLIAVGDSFGKNEIPRAMENVQKGLTEVSKQVESNVKRTVKNIIRFGEDIGRSFEELGKENVTQEDRLNVLRASAFRRALQEGRWAWMEAHISELHDPDLLQQIAESASVAGMKDWIRKNLPAYADAELIRLAIEEGDWGWLGENVWRFDPEMQQKVAMAATEAENWQWLSVNAESLDLRACIVEITDKARSAGARMLAVQLARFDMVSEQLEEVAMKALDAKDFDFFGMIAETLPAEMAGRCLVHLAKSGDWEQVLRFAAMSDISGLEWLMQLAIDDAPFDMIDKLETIIKARYTEE